MAFRVDISRLESVEKTPQGGIRAPVTIMRTGILEYVGPDGGKVHEYRPPEEHGPAALKTFENAPITNDHPPEHVHTGNFKKYAVGHLEPGVRQEGGKVAGVAVVQDAATIKAIEGGKRDVSAGYHCDISETPGVAAAGEECPSCGTNRYERVQRNLRGNHMAVVHSARAGSEVHLRLDSNGDAITNDARANMEYETIEGTKYQVGTDAHRAAVTRRDEKARADAKELADAKAERDREKARADAAAADLKKREDAAAQQLTPQALDRRVQVRQAVIEVAKAPGVLGKDFKADGLTNDQIKAKAIEKVYPGLRLDGASRDYLKGLFVSIARKVREDAEKAGQRRVDGADRARMGAVPVPPPGAMGGPRQDGARPSARTPDEIRFDALAEQDLRAHRPLAMSKQDRFKTVTNHPSLQSAQLETQH